MSNMKAYIVFAFVVLLSFGLLISEGESKMTLSTRITAQPLLVCDKIYGTQVGDTCFSIIQAFKLTTDAFNALNPNLNCDKVFVGEWLCLHGTAL
ncbi:hypothetical protein QVD17_31445 [Tagetes erecta]|uniref:LysM domain-containing protein n=1 Tax=Tagetes erecta TaxID=13708 RepID=A0AAD8K9S8_TARER|nr:hypothetical protein QVD17_31445 [Tagetes erecta]